MPELIVVPIDFKQACAFVDRVHRHHRAPQGHKFSLAVVDAGGLVRGVVVVGRPVNRGLDDGWTLEVTRLATDGVKNGCSMLYGAAGRATKALGYERVITYILDSESGVSLRAAGWTRVADVKGQPWNSKARERADAHPLCDKARWERVVGERVVGFPPRRKYGEAEDTNMVLEFPDA